MSNTKKEWESDYKLIPMSEITDEARELSVRWMECGDKNWIGQKHKLASDIMNYARRQSAEKDKLIEITHANLLAALEENKKLKEKVETMTTEYNELWDQAQSWREESGNLPMP